MDNLEHSRSIVGEIAYPGFRFPNPNPKSFEVATWPPQRVALREEAIGPPPRKILQWLYEVAFDCQTRELGQPITRPGLDVHLFQLGPHHYYQGKGGLGPP